MIIKKYSFYLTIIFSLVFGYYGSGLSISESDNNDAIYFNPAGLAIDHGFQFDFFGLNLRQYTYNLLCMFFLI